MHESLKNLAKVFHYRFRGGIIEIQSIKGPRYRGRIATLVGDLPEGIIKVAELEVELSKGSGPHSLRKRPVNIGLIEAEQNPFGQNGIIDVERCNVAERDDGRCVVSTPHDELIFIFHPRVRRSAPRAAFR